ARQLLAVEAAGLALLVSGLAGAGGGARRDQAGVGQRALPRALAGQPRLDRAAGAGVVLQREPLAIGAGGAARAVGAALARGGEGGAAGDGGGRLGLGAEGAGHAGPVAAGVADGGRRSGGRAAREAAVLQLHLADVGRGLAVVGRDTEPVRGHLAHQGLAAGGAVALGDEALAGHGLQGV